MWVLSRKGPSGFSSSNTAEEVTNGINGVGLTAIVTGASRGIGRETVRVLALRGVHVIMAVRNTITTTSIKEEIIKQIPSAKVDVMELDLSSMASVRKFASDFISLGVPLNILINNAGVNEPNFSLSPDNVQRVFATNHLGHFVLTNLLSETMKNTANQSNIEGRIINVSSEGYRLTYREGIRFDQINNESRYVGMYAYFESKLANVLHANELARRLEVDGVQVTANSLHPGSILTDIWMKYSLLKVFATTIGKILLKNVPQGAATTCYVALHPNVKGVNGEYFMDNNISKTNSQAKDAELAKKLWDFSMNLIQNSSSDLVK